MIALTLLFGIGAAQAQSNVSQNAVYIELGGNAIVYSVNAERRIHPNIAISVGVGSAGFYEPTNDTRFGWVLNPLRVHGLFGKGPHHLEAALGVTWGVARGDMNAPDNPSSFWILNATSALGYRYQKPEGGLVLRATFTPHYGGERFAPLGAAFQPWGGVSVGWAW